MNSLERRAVFMTLALLLLPGQSIHSAFDEDQIQNGVTLEARERLMSNLIAPPIRFTLRNGDPQTGLFYTLDTGSLDDVRTWQIQIFDRRRRKISFIQGRNSPPAMVSWSGVSDSGALLPDGFYTAQFGWQDSHKQIYTTKTISFALFTAPELRSLSDWKLKLDYTTEGLEMSIDESRIFKSGQSKIQEEVLPAMKQIVLFLKSCSKNMVTVRGHTDSTGSVIGNLMLSRERANYVYQYLVNGGIDPKRLTYEGMGTSQFIADNKTEEGRSKNRRVEIIVLKTTI